MKIEIDDNKTVGQISHAFQKQWPNLKIDFFQHTHATDEASPKKELLDENLYLGSVRNLHNPGTILIKATDPIKDVEKRFEDNYGLHVKIFHKMGDNWIESTTTANRTIAEQNSISDEFNEPVDTEIEPYEPDVQ